jgi:hypothetical protein
MADPVQHDCPVNEWTKIADGVTLGMIKILETKAGYHFTFRDHTNAPPDPADYVNVQRCNTLRAAIRSPADQLIDVYCWCPAGTQGRVEVAYYA